MLESPQNFIVKKRVYFFLFRKGRGEQFFLCFFPKRNFFGVCTKEEKNSKLFIRTSQVVSKHSEKAKSEFFSKNIFLTKTWVRFSK